MAWWRRPYLWLVVVVAIPCFVGLAAVTRGRMLVREGLAAEDRLSHAGIGVRGYALRDEVPRSAWQEWLEGHDVWVTVSLQDDDSPLLMDDILRLRRVRGLTIGSPLSTVDARRFAQLPMLEQVVVADEQVSAEAIKALSSAPGIIYYNLQRTNVDDDCLAVIAELPRLQHLDLQYTDVSEEAANALHAARPEVEITWRPRVPETGEVSFDELAKRPVKLRMRAPKGISRYADYGVEFTRQPDEETLALVAKLKNVREITSWVGFTDNDIPSLLQWPSLQRVNLLHASVTSGGVQKLAALSELSEIAISESSMVNWTSQDWQSLHDVLPDVTIWVTSH